MKAYFITLNATHDAKTGDGVPCFSIMETLPKSGNHFVDYIMHGYRGFQLMVDDLKMYMHTFYDRDVILKALDDTEEENVYPSIAFKCGPFLICICCRELESVPQRACDLEQEKPTIAMPESKEAFASLPTWQQKILAKRAQDKVLDTINSLLKLDGASADNIRPSHN